MIFLTFGIRMIYKSQDIQRSFLHFFEKKQHEIIEGSSVIPFEDDTTLLFTNAGMNQFKDFFIGVTIPDYDAATTAQRCIRAGGKHNDLDQVGFTARHLTSFTMLGNFSFGIYFKEEAIRYAWEYLTEVLQLEKEKLWVTVFESDDEAFAIWNEKIGVDKNKIFRLGEKDNFWQMGDVGPCGPCSEIYFDRGIKNEGDRISFPGDDQSTRFMEIWNLVFMQFEKQLNGVLLPLKKVGVDTGMGLERLASVIQNTESVFQTDLFLPLIQHIELVTDKKYISDLQAAFHVVIDHIRTASILVYSGIIPGNEGRGYVLRKIIRRALLFSKKLSGEISFFSSLVIPLVSNKDLLYGDLFNKKECIMSIILEESKKFFTNLQTGMVLFDELVKKQKNKKYFSGADAFTLYDTYGFPLEITTILTEEKGMKININEYEQKMQEQRERSKQNQKFKSTQKNTLSEIETEFLGYEKSDCHGIIKELFVDGNLVEESIPYQEVTLILDKTVFYPTGGGQVSDSGYIEVKGKKIPILSSKKYGNAIGITVLSDHIFYRNDIVNQKIDQDVRKESARHHSAVHLLHKVLQTYYKDDSLYQDGSFVCDNYFTLDMKMKQECSYQDKKNIEKIINSYINDNYPIEYNYMSLEEAKKTGATAQFAEKYNKDRVRVVSIKSITDDLCGGCHATGTKELGLFILKEVKSQGNGIKRFTGVVSKLAYEYLSLLEKVILELKVSLACPIEKIESQVDQKDFILREKDKMIDDLKKQLMKKEIDMIKQLHKDEHIFLEIPSYLTGYEKNILEQLKNNYSSIFLYVKKELGKAFMVGYLNKDKMPKNKADFFEKELAEKYNYRGKISNNFFQGMITV